LAAHLPRGVPLAEQEVELKKEMSATQLDSRLRRVWEKLRAVEDVAANIWSPDHGKWRNGRWECLY
jgi:hypothetical protein